MRYGHIDHMHLCWGHWWGIVVPSAEVPIDASHGGVWQQVVGGKILLHGSLWQFEYHSCFC